MNATIHDDIDDLIAHGRDYAGFISMGPAVLPPDKLRELHEALPYGVFIDINPSPNLFDSVQPDLEQIVLDALDALKASGCRRIGFIGGAGTMMGSTRTPRISVVSRSTIGARGSVWILRVWCMRTAHSPSTTGVNRANG